MGINILTERLLEKVEKLDLECPAREPA